MLLHLRGLALISLVAVAGCGIKGPESPESCIARFEGKLAKLPAGTRFQPIFTYDITQMENVPETLFGEGEALNDVRLTISHGASDPALKAFYESELPERGAIFAADDFTLFRVSGMEGTRDEALLAGCKKNAPTNARLIQIQWNALPQITKDIARKN